MDAIALIGPPGSGKTAVGRVLARRLELPFVDIADELGGGGAVVELGSTEATSQATEIARQAAATPCVIAVPSWVTSPATPARTIYLSSSAAETYARSGMNVPGPVGLVNPRSMWALLLRERDPEYRAAADLVIDASRKTVDEVAAEVLAYLR